MTEAPTINDDPMAVRSNNPQQPSQLGRLSGIPLRRLKLEHNTLRAKQEILAKFMHLKRGDTTSIPALRMEPKTRSLGCGAYSIRVVASDCKVPSLPMQNSYNTDVIAQCDSK